MKSPLNLVAFLILMVAVSLPGSASAAMNQNAQQRAKNLVQTQGKVKVIVSLKNDKRLLNSDTSRLASSRSKLDNIKRKFKATKSDSGQLKIVQEYKHIPSMVMEVDADGLQNLIDDEDIIVYENRVARPALAQSVKLVYPSRKFSPYHGNNEWAVAIIDSGVNSNHPMLAGKVVSEACYSTTDTSDFDVDTHNFSLCPGGVDSSTVAGSGNDCSLTINGCGHGTQMAGIAVGSEHASGRVGVAKDGKIISIKVFTRTDNFDCPDGNPPCLEAATSDILAALDRVYDLRNTHKIAAVNMSLIFQTSAVSEFCDSDPLKASIDMLRSVGIPTVVPTGNSGELGFLSNPACISSTFSVGATEDTSNSLWSVSSDEGTNASELMDLFAPGSNITTASGSSSFITVSGTSASAAHVSGAFVAARHALEASGSNTSLTALEQLFRSNGPIVYQPEPSVNIRRLDVRSILSDIDPESQIPDITISPILFLLLDD